MSTPLGERSAERRRPRRSRADIDPAKRFRARLKFLWRGSVLRRHARRRGRARSLEEAASWLGLAVANIITTYNPDKIVLGGPLGLMDSPLLDMVRIEASRWAMQHPFKAAAIERGVLGESVGAFGAACLVLDRKLNLAVRVLEKKSRGGE